MFDRVSSNQFQNRQHVGDFSEISFDIAMDNDNTKIETVSASIHYLKFGEGEPLVLLHGIGQSMFTWRKCFWMLENNYTVYAIDLPGHGCSEQAAMAYAVEDFSLTLESFFMVQGIEKAHVVAFGESSTYALDFAQQNPDKVLSVVLVSPMMERDDFKGKCMMPFVSAGSRFMFSKKSFFSDLESWFFDKTAVTDMLLKEYYIPFDDKEFRQIIKVAATNYNDIEVKERISLIKAPMLIVRGVDDKLSPELDKGLGGLPLLKAKAFNVRNCGWLVQEEKPDKLCAAIDQFVGLIKE